MSKLQKPVQMAVIGAPHGVTGEVRVQPFSEDPTGFASYGPLYDRSGRAFEVTAVRPANTVVVARFKGVATREQAQALTGVELFVDRAALPEDLDDGEFYHADLVGLRVEDEAGETIGKVLAFHNFGGGDILEIVTATKATVLIPFTQAAVPEIDVAGGLVRVDSAAAGLAGGEDGTEEPAGDAR